MAFVERKFGIQKRIYYFRHKPRAYYPLAERDDIRVVMQSCHLRGKHVVTVRATYALNLIRGYAHADTRSAYKYAAVKLAASSAFGGISDNRRTKVDSGTPSLVINGKVAFGGVELRD